MLRSINYLDTCLLRAAPPVLFLPLSSRKQRAGNIDILTGSFSVFLFWFCSTFLQKLYLVLYFGFLVVCVQALLIFTSHSTKYRCNFSSYSNILILKKAVSQKNNRQCYASTSMKTLWCTSNMTSQSKLFSQAKPPATLSLYQYVCILLAGVAKRFRVI